MFPCRPLAFQWMNPSAFVTQAQQLRGVTEHWALQGASRSPASEEGSRGRRLLHSITLPLDNNNNKKKIQKAHITTFGKKLSPEGRKKVTNLSWVFLNSKPLFLQETAFSSDAGQSGSLKMSHCGKVLLHLSVLADRLLWISTQNKFTLFSA